MNSLNRSYNGCTACCDGTLMGKAKEHYFYPGKPCHFMAEGDGCTIYEDRPKLCRMFECVWLTDPTVPDELWPGSSHAIIVPGPHLVPQHGHAVSTEHQALYEQWVSSKTTDGTEEPSPDAPYAEYLDL